MSEEQAVEAQENVAEELTEWSEVDLSPEDKKEKVEFEVEVLNQKNWWQNQSQLQKLNQKVHGDRLMNI